MIINTLTKLKATGLKHGTLYTTSYTLKKIAEHADLLKPEEVKTYVALQEQPPKSIQLFLRHK